MSTPPLLLNVAEQLLNRYLALDPEISAQFGELEGKCLAFEITAPELTFYCLPHAGAVELRSAYEGGEDCRLRGTALALLKMARSDSPAEHLSSGEVEIIGDNRVAQRFSDILAAVEIDWEELASRLVGDFTAHRLGNVARGFNRWVADSVAALRMDTTEYLQEEAGILPTRVEVEAFMAEVDTFRSDVDRLEARIRRLERRLRQREGER